MKNLTEDKLEEFIRKNKSEFNVYKPAENHEKKFIAKLMIRLRRAFINITPYLIKVIIATVLIWAISLVLEFMFHIPTLWDLAIKLFKK